MRLLIFILLIFTLPAKAQNVVGAVTTLQKPFTDLSVERDFYVSNSGTGDGFTEPNPMSVADFLSAEVYNGNNVYFNKGEVYELGNKVISNGHVTVSHYGTGAAPMFTGSEDISGLTWNNEGGGTYSTTMVTEPKWIWIAGKCAKMAETPRIDVLGRPSTTRIVIDNADVSGYSSIIGSYIVVKIAYWTQSLRRKVTAYSPGSGEITVDGTILSNSTNIDLVLQNDTEYFVGDNEWAWTSGVLYVKAAASPSTLDIRQNQYDYAFYSRNKLTVIGLDFEDYYTAAIWHNSIDEEELTIDSVDFRDIRDVGVLVQKKIDSLNIQHSTFERIGNNGILMRPGSYGLVSRNVFDSIGMQPNWPTQTWLDGPSITYSETVGAAITYRIDALYPNDDGREMTYERNTVSYTAYAGLHKGVGTHNTFQYNEISFFCQRFQDGAGIYSFHYLATGSDSSSIFQYNYIHDGPSPVYSDRYEVGIYCDNRTIQANVHHNTLVNLQFGVFLNFDTKESTVENNNFFNCTKFALLISERDVGTNLHVNIDNNVNNNVFASATSTQKAIWFELNYSFPTWNPYATADFNYYVKNFGTPIIADSDNKGLNLTLTTLRTAYGKDASSVARLYTPVIVVNWTDAISNEDALSNYKDLDGNVLTTYTIPAFYSRIIAEL